VAVYSLAERSRAQAESGRLDQLTGLPEYRNGGLLVDAGALRPKQRTLLEKNICRGRRSRSSNGVR